MKQAAAEGFNADHGLFTATATGLAYPQPKAVQVPNGLALLNILGAMFGKVRALALAKSVHVQLSALECSPDAEHRGKLTMQAPHTTP